MEFTIYSLGNVDFLAQILNAVAMICGTGNYSRLIASGFVIGLLYLGFQTIFQGGQRINLMQTLVCFIVYMCMFGPSCTVLIEDVYKGRVQNVDNVPLGVGVSGMAISGIGYNVTKMMEQAFSPLDRTTEHGFAEPLRIINELRSLSTDRDQMWIIVDRNLGSWEGGRTNSKQAVTNYLSECLFVDVALNRINVQDIASNSWENENVFRSQSDAHTVYLPIPGTNSQTGVVACSRAYDIIDRQVAQQFASRNMDAFYNQRLNLIAQGQIDAGEGGVDKIHTALQFMNVAMQDMQDFMMTFAINSVYDEAQKDFYMTYHDPVTASAVRQAQIQRDTQWASESTMFLSAARALMAFFEGFLYAITPIMGFLIVTGAFGLSLVGKYFLLIVWVQLWLPILSIVNLYISIASTAAVSSALGNTVSMYTLNEAWAQTATWVATGGMLAAATPILALFLITGSTYAFTTMAGRLGGQDHFNERVGSPDALTNGAVVQHAAAQNSNAVSGVIKTGAESFLPTLSMSSAASQHLSVTRAAAQSQISDVMQSVRRATAQGTKVADMASLTRALNSASGSVLSQSQSANLSHSAADSSTTGRKSEAGDTSTQTLDGSIGGGGSFGYGKKAAIKKPTKTDDVATATGVAADEGNGSGLRDKLNDTLKKIDDFFPVGVGVSGGIQASRASSDFRKSEESEGESFSRGSSSSHSSSLDNTRTNSEQISKTRAAAESMERFAQANRGTEVGQQAHEAAAALRSYAQAQQSMQTESMRQDVRVDQVAHELNDSQFAELQRYFQMRHGDKAQEIMGLAAKYAGYMGGGIPGVFGNNNQQALAAAQITTLYNGDNQDKAFLGRMLAEGNVPTAMADYIGKFNPDMAGMSTVENKVSSGMAQTQMAVGDNTAADNKKIIQGQVSEPDLAKGKQELSKANAKGVESVRKAAGVFEGSASQDARRRAINGLLNSSRADFLDKATGFFGDGSPTERRSMMLTDFRQSIFGLTQTQKEAVEQIARENPLSWRGDVSDAGVRQELRQAMWGNEKLTPEREQLLDKLTKSTMDHLAAVAFTGQQGVAEPLRSFNVAFDLQKGKNQ